MPYTTNQIARILGSGASRVLPSSADLTLSQAVSESEVRRRVYSYEDAAARDVLARFKRAYADIRDYSNALAEMGSIRTLSTSSGATNEWKRRLTFYGQERITTLMNDCANLVIQRVPTAFNAGYLGRAWSIEVSTIDSVHPTYSVKDSRVILDTFATAWQKRAGTAFYESFDAIADDYKLKLRKQLNSAIVNGETVMDANKRVQRLFGLNRGSASSPFHKDRALTLGEMYFAAQSNVRLAIMTAANAGALRLYAENTRVQEAFGIGAAAIFLTAGDGRVCNICRPYAGRMFRLDSLLGAALSLAIEPPLHYGCRCGMVIVIAPEDLLPDEMPPGMTLLEWLILAGLEHLLGDFMDEGIESTQVGDEVSYADI